MAKPLKTQQNPFVPDDVITFYSTRSVLGASEKKEIGRPRALAKNRTYENLLRLKQLYVDVLSSLERKLRENYGHDDDLYKSTTNKLKDRIDNKIRSDNQGKLFIQVNDKLFFDGSSKDYEKYFHSTKKNFHKVLREIGKELLGVLNQNAPEEDGKPFKFDKKEK